jgi:hypothetical protein
VVLAVAFPKVFRCRYSLVALGPLVLRGLLGLPWLLHRHSVHLCYEKDTANPPYCALQAIDLDGTVLSAPSIDSNNFPGSAEISGISSELFTKAKAMEIAAQVRAASKMTPISG